MEVITIQTEAYQEIIKSLNEIKEIIPKNKIPPLSESWLDTDEVCKILRISKRTLQNYRDKNYIPFAQFGTKIYYKKEDVEIHLNEHYIGKRK